MNEMVGIPYSLHMNCMHCWKQNNTNACIAQYMNTCIALNLNTCIALYNEIRFSCHKWVPRRPTACPSVASLNLLVYQSLPISIPYRHALLRRRQDDTGVGKAARGIVA